MNPVEWIRGLSDGQAPADRPFTEDWLDILVEVEDRGRGGTRWLADQLGVDIRQAQRYLKLDTMPSGKGRPGAERLAAELRERRADESEGASRADVAALIRAMSSLTPHKIVTKSKSDESAEEREYTIRGSLDRAGPGLALVADRWEQGDEEGAGDALSDCVIALYGDEPADAIEGLAAVLYITDFPEGMDYA